MPASSSFIRIASASTDSKVILEVFGKRGSFGGTRLVDGLIERVLVDVAVERVREDVAIVEVPREGHVRAEGPARTVVNSRSGRHSFRKGITFQTSPV
jgi:hypothetical protein